MIKRSKHTSFITLYCQVAAELLGLLDAIICFASLTLLCSDLKTDFMCSDHVYNLLKED